MWASPFLTGVPCPPPLLPQPTRTPGFGVHVLSPSEPLTGLGVPMTNNMQQSFPLLFPRFQFPGVPSTLSTHHPLQSTMGLPQSAITPHNAWNVTYISPYTPLTLTSGKVSTSSSEIMAEGNAAVSESADGKTRTSGAIRGPLTAIDLELEKINNATGMGRQSNGESKEDELPTEGCSNLGQDLVSPRLQQHHYHSSLSSADRKRVQSPPVFGNGFLIPSPKAASTPLKLTDQDAAPQQARKTTKTKSKIHKKRQERDSNSHPNGIDGGESSSAQPLDLRINKGHAKRRAEDSISESAPTPQTKRIKTEFAETGNASPSGEGLQTPAHSSLAVNRSKKTKSRCLNGKRERVHISPLQHQSRSFECQPMDFSGLSVNKENVVPAIKQEKSSGEFVDSGCRGSPRSFGSLAKSSSPENGTPSIIYSTFDSGIAQNSWMKNGLCSSYLTSQSVVDYCIKDSPNPDDSGLSKSLKNAGKCVESSTDGLPAAGAELAKSQSFESQQLMKTKSSASMPRISTDLNSDKSCPMIASSQVDKSVRYTCPYSGCPSVFSQMRHLNHHCRQTHGEKSFKCSFEGCGKSYATRSTLRHHQFVHTDTFKCTWPNCEKRFRDDYNLRTHYMIHTGKKPRQCRLCDYACVQKNSMDWHMKTKHSQQ